MAIENGLYKVAFQTPIGVGYGVVVLRDGQLLGGDSAMFYAGDYDQSGDAFTANIQIDTHSAVPGFGSVFGVPKAQIKLAGNTANQPLTVSGTSPQAPGVSFQATLHHLK